MRPNKIESRIMNEPLRITAELKTPVIIQGYLTFDALMGALLFERYEDVEKAHNDIPIKSEHGLFHASAAQVEIIDRGGVALVANLRATHDLDPDLLKKNNKGTKVHRKITLLKRQDFGPVLNNYRTITASKISWEVVGDKFLISDLLKAAFFIGKKRTAGFGEIIKWSFENIETDGLVSTDQNPLRPIPVERFQGNKLLPIVDTAWKPAYWNPENRSACYAPEPIS